MAFGAIWRHVQAKRAAHQWKVLQSHRVDAKTLMLGMVGETWQLVMARNMTRLDKTTGGNIFCLCVDGCWWCSRCFKWRGVVVWNRFGLPEHFSLARGQNTEKEFIEMVWAQMGSKLAKGQLAPDGGATMRGEFFCKTSPLRHQSSAGPCTEPGLGAMMPHSLD